MNSRQRIILIAAGVIMLLMIVVLPWKDPSSGLSFGYNSFMRYQYPHPNGGDTILGVVDSSKLAVQFAGIAVITALLVLSLRDKK
jgi:hypothetical protein